MICICLHLIGACPKTIKFLTFIDSFCILEGEDRTMREGTCKQGIDRLWGVLTSNRVTVIDTTGYLVRFMIFSDPVHDLAGVPLLLDGLLSAALFSDKAFTADWLLENLEEGGASPAWPRTESRDHHRHLRLAASDWTHKESRSLG